MTEDEIIAVVQAFKDGAKIECKHEMESTWYPTDKPVWDFDTHDYRVAEPKWRDATIDDLKRAPLKCRVRDGEQHEWMKDLFVGYVAAGNGLPRWMIRGGECYPQCQVQDN